MACVVFYYAVVQYLPSNYLPVIGKWMRAIRYLCCKNIFSHCGKNVNVQRKAHFGKGFGVVIGDNSGLGGRCRVPGDIRIGNNVMMAENFLAFGCNHRFDRTDIPMIFQGNDERKITVIEDDVWIGANVIFTPGRTVKTGTVIAAGSVVTKDFPAYAVIGGNPARILRMRKEEI